MMKSFTCICAIMWLLISCSDKTPIINDVVPKHDSLIVESTYLKEKRVINIWTPKNYGTSEDSFPVLYMLDGGVKEDFPHIANTLDTLITTGKIKPIILIGIENTQRRRDLTGPTTVAKDKEIAPVVGGAETFRSFIRNELMPQINKKYRVSSEEGIIGESLAGLFITETLLMYPDLFDYYIAMDPSLWWNDQYLVRNAKNYLAKFPNEPKRYWFAGSSAEDINVATQQLTAMLNAAKVASLEWNYLDAPKEQHNTIFRATKEQALIWTWKK
jgi:uncharacterized protein